MVYGECISSLIYTQSTEGINRSNDFRAVASRKYILNEIISHFYGACSMIEERKKINNFHP